MPQKCNLAFGKYANNYFSANQEITAYENNFLFLFFFFTTNEMKISLCLVKSTVSPEYCPPPSPCPPPPTSDTEPSSKKKSLLPMLAARLHSSAPSGRTVLLQRMLEGTGSACLAAVSWVVCPCSTHSSASPQRVWNSATCCPKSPETPSAHTHRAEPGKPHLYYGTILWL